MSANNTQFSIAIHLMAGLGYGVRSDITSTDLAASVNACPSFVRRILSKLSKAGLVRTLRGKSGTSQLGRPAKEITLLDIYRAVEAPKVFAVHAYPAQSLCPVSCGFQHMIDHVLERAQISFEETLTKTTLAEVIEAIKKAA